jgi:hypothetical protein
MKIKDLAFSGSFLVVIALIQSHLVQSQIADKVFKEPIKTVYLSQNKTNELIVDNLCISIEKQGIATLIFDDLNLENTNYFLRIIHCQSDWKPSPLNEIEYLNDFNDIPIRYPETSMGTKIPYKQYKITLPQLKLSGNYIAMVYANRNKRDTVLSKRFSIYQNEINIGSKISFAKSNALRSTHQFIDLNLGYPSTYLINSEENLKIEIRKNNQSKNVLAKIPKPMVQAIDRTLTYLFYDQENAILGGNEFRLIDLRSTQQKLNYVGQINTLDRYTEISTLPEQAQGNYSYVQRPDFNGAYVIANYENPNNPLQADYVWCTFILKSRKFEDEKIYVNGAFNSYELNYKNQLQYDEAKGAYLGKILLKQGIYNYQFVSSNSLNNNLEGDHAETENYYEILVYFRRPGERFDSLIGYQKIQFPL